MWLGPAARVSHTLYKSHEFKSNPKPPIQTTNLIGNQRPKLGPPVPGRCLLRRSSLNTPANSGSHSAGLKPANGSCLESVARYLGLGVQCESLGLNNQNTIHPHHRVQDVGFSGRVPRPMVATRKKNGGTQLWVAFNREPPPTETAGMVPRIRKGEAAFDQRAPSSTAGTGFLV